MFSSKKILFSNRPTSTVATTTATPTTTAEPTTGLFRIGDSNGADFFVRVEDQEKANQFRRIINGTEPNLRVGGTIIKENVCWNPNWSYHYDPQSVYLFESSVEVCDASFQYVEDNLADAGGAFLPNNNHCPWASYLVEEVDSTCPIANESNPIIGASNTRRININWLNLNLLDLMYIEVDYADGNGWLGYQHIPNSDSKSTYKQAIGSLFPGTKYQRYRLRYQSGSNDPTEFTNWSYTNILYQFKNGTTEPTNNNICAS
jgi:hypothetical protein